MAGCAVVGEPPASGDVANAGLDRRSLATQAAVIGGEILHVGVAQRLRDRRHHDVLLRAGLVRAKNPGQIGGVLPGQVRPRVVRADAVGAVTACAGGRAPCTCRRVTGHQRACAHDLGRMGVVTDDALLAGCMLRHLDLRMRLRPSRHRLVAQAAESHRIGGNRQPAILRMPLGCAMAGLAADGLVTIGRPLGQALAMAALAVMRRLKDGFLGGKLGNRRGAVRPVVVERLGGEVGLGGVPERCGRGHEQQEARDVLGHRLSRCK